MYQKMYEIENTINLDKHSCFTTSSSYPGFQKDLDKFKTLLVQLVNKKESKTFYKFGDGDYYFLTKQSVGSASPGKRALSKSYDSINHEKFVDGAQLCDYYTCEIYPENRKMFSEVIARSIDFPAEYGYGLVANKWILQTFSGKIGLLGADNKINIIENLMESTQYQDYLGIEKFNNYFKLPQKFACDDLENTEKIVGKQLEKSNSDIILMGMGHVKSGLIHRLKKYTNAVFLDVGSAIDALAGIIDVERPFFGDWTNYQIDDSKLYEGVDYLQYQGRGKRVVLEEIK